jgi:hypothetical protein
MAVHAGNTYLTSAVRIAARGLSREPNVPIRKLESVSLHQKIRHRPKLTAKTSEELYMTDRRPLNPNVTVPKKGGGEQPRSRNEDGQIRKKRDDTGKTRKP